MCEYVISFRTVPLAIIVQLLAYHRFLARMDFTQILPNRRSALYVQKATGVQVLVTNQHRVTLGSSVKLAIAHVLCVPQVMNALMVS